MTTTITRRVEIDCGHRVPFHDGKCHRLHGHRYEIEVTVSADVRPDVPHDPAAGMILDFGAVSHVLRTIVEDRYDHRLILWRSDPLIGALPGEMLDDLCIVDVIPTAENLAALWGHDLVGALAPFGVTVTGLVVWETRKSSAAWTP